MQKEQKEPPLLQPATPKANKIRIKLHLEGTHITSQTIMDSLKLLEIEEVESGLIKNRLSYQDVVSSELLSHTSNKKCLLIDVRTSQEYQSVHLSSAKSIPLTVISRQASIDFLRSSVNSGQYILIYCSNDSRSIAAMKILTENQICASRLKGGMKGLGF